jgi:putative salt-induced outer membrane protein YdiY
VRRSVLVLAGLSLLGVSTRADRVVLKNGDRLTGVIEKSDVKGDDQVKMMVLVIKTEAAGEISIKWDAVASIVAPEPLHLELKDGQNVVGAVTTVDGKFDVATATTGEVATSKDTVIAVRNDAEQTAHEAEVERLKNPRLTDFWSGTVDTGLSLTRGNSSTLSYNLAAKAVRETPRDKITVYTTAVYASDDTTPPHRTTAHGIIGGLRGDFNLSDRMFVFGFTDFEYDEFQHLDLRNVLGGGVGYHVRKTANTTFDVFGGADYEQEYFSPNPPVILTNITRKTGEIVVGEEFDAKLNGRTTFAEKMSFFPNVSDMGEYRFQFDASAASKLKTWLSWQVTYSDRYISNPLVGLKGNDQLLTTGLRMTLANRNCSWRFAYQRL